MSAPSGPHRRGRALIVVVRLAWDSAAGVCGGLVATTVIGGVAPVAGAWLTKDLIDLLATRAGGGTPATSAVLATGGGLIVALAAGCLAAVTDERLAAELERRLRLAVQHGLSARIIGFRGLAVFEDPQVRNEIRRAQEGGQAAPVVRLATAVARQGLTITGFIVVLAGVDATLALLIAAAASPGLAGRRHLSRHQAQLAATVSSAGRRGASYNALQVDLRAVKEIRLFGLGAYFHGRMLRELAVISRREQRAGRRHLRVRLALTIAGLAVSSAALVHVLRAATVGAVTVGQATLALAALVVVQVSCANLAPEVAQLSDGLRSFAGYDRFVAHPADMDGGQAGGAVQPLRRAITFENVWFRYRDGGPWVLRGVSLEIPAHGSVGLFGGNGAGKSTIVKLLCRLYDPQHGVVRWDGVDVRWFDIDDLRRTMTAVFQDRMEYELSAADNIGLGDLEHVEDRERIVAAARRAGVDRDLGRLPAGYDTLLTRASDNGVVAPGASLSAGQWQKVAIARMLLRDDAQIALLDEPGHALDADAEHDLRQVLRSLARERTVVLATHRMSTVRLADRVYVVEGGRIVESGTHDGLLARGGAYARMFVRQAGTHE